MDLKEYQRLVGAIRFGKRLPTAVYVHRDESTLLGEELDRLIGQLVATFQVGRAFNVLKLRADAARVSFLAYHRFFCDPHPTLRHALTIDLVHGKARSTDYASNPNPPILHRKETLLRADHPKRALFSALTEAEEAAELYADTATIGFKLNWERLLAAKGLQYAGHRLLPVKDNGGIDRHLSMNLSAPSPRPSPPVEEREQVVVVERHKTALVRYELSKPVRTLLEHGQLRSGVTFFDYGCGQGSDVSGLRNLGYTAHGWDPVHRPGVAKAEADIVNLGYVLNVIEDAAERLETLVDAFRHTRQLLVVSALIHETVDKGLARPYGDGVLTRANTFQYTSSWAGRMSRRCTCIGAWWTNSRRCYAPMWDAPPRCSAMSSRPTS